jgi:hypothetical protein
MELARILTELWSKKRLLGVGAAIAALIALSTVASISLFPPSVKGKGIVFATASTQMIVDTPQSSLGDLSSDLGPLSARAGIFARFMTSAEALDYIGREAGIPGNEIQAQGPFEIGMPASVHVPEGANGAHVQPRYRLQFDQNPELPIVNVFARAPDSAQATKLANAAVIGLSKYLNDLEDQEGIAAGKRVDIRQLGNATGGVVNPGANKKIALLAFLVVFTLWCGLVLFGTRVVAGLRAARAGAPEPEPEAPHSILYEEPAIVLPRVVDRGR